MDPEGTSKGMWRVGDGTKELFGRFQIIFCKIFMSRLLSNLPEDLTRNWISTPWSSSLTGGVDNIVPISLLQKLVGRPSTLSREGVSAQAGLFWQVFLDVLIFAFYWSCFSGVGVFQVKFDGQLRVSEDENSVSCNYHCLRVQKNNTGRRKTQNAKDKDTNYF